MAVDMEKLIAESLLKLNNTHSVKKITVKMILNDCGVSRQTFYNHFKDKNDLIYYVYKRYIIPDFNSASSEQSFQGNLLNSLNAMKEFHHFLKQAFMIEDQNNLSNQSLKHTIEFDLDWLRAHYGKDLPEDMRFACIYHAHASHAMVITWLLADMPVSPQEVAEMITSLRSFGMDRWFGSDNPYKK